MENFNKDNLETTAEENDGNIGVNDNPTPAEAFPEEETERKTFTEKIMDLFEDEEEENGVEDAYFDGEEELQVEQRIEIPEVEETDSKQGKTGAKIFCLILVFALVISSVATVSYFAGKRSGESATITGKPSDVAVSNASEVFSKVNPSVVGLLIYNSNNKAYNVSGIVYSEDGYIITTDAMLALVDAPRFRVYTADGKEYLANFVGGDQRSDIAVLKIKENVKLTPASLGDVGGIVVGESVYSVGRPNGYSEASVITEGIVSSELLRIAGNVTSYSSVMLQSTVPVNSGDFGGALSNSYGQVVGMMSKKVASAVYGEVVDLNEQITYSVPANTLKTIADQIIKNGKADDRARLGISYYLKDSAAAELEGLKSSGLLVADVDKESELYSVLKPKDIITEINGQKILKDDIVLDIIEAAKPGDKIKIKVVSDDGSSKEYTVKLLSYESKSSYIPLPAIEGAGSGGNELGGF